MSVEYQTHRYPDWVNCQLKLENPHVSSRPNGIQETPEGKFLVLDSANAVEVLPNCVWWRNFQIANQIRNVVDSEHMVVVPQKPISSEELDSQLKKHGLDSKDCWVYGSILPTELWNRSTKAQVHLPHPKDEVPAWFDRKFPESIQETTLPGMTCFSLETLEEGAIEMLGTYKEIRLKDPNGASGEDQTVIADMGDLAKFIEMKSAHTGGREGLVAYLKKHGYVMEANMEKVVAWSCTATYLPNGEVYTSIGQQIESTVPLPPEKGGGTMKEYGGTSAVTFRGLPQEYRNLNIDSVPVFDPAHPLTPLHIDINTQVLHAAQKHMEGMKLWEADGIYRTRANIDILTGEIVYKDGRREFVARSVEDSGRIGGASSEEIRSIACLQYDHDTQYAVHSSRHVFTQEEAQPYIQHIQESSGTIFWEGEDQTWGDKYVTMVVI